MTFQADIDIMPHPELLDPQGKAVASSLHSLGFDGVQQVRVGKHIHLSVEAASLAEATAQVESACQKLLANAIMEGYQYTIAEAKK